MFLSDPKWPMGAELATIAVDCLFANLRKGASLVPETAQVEILHAPGRCGAAGAPPRDCSQGARPAGPAPLFFRCRAGALFASQGIPPGRRTGPARGN